MRNRKSTQGFTLIELLIVIAIIGILAAVLIPNLLAARSRAFDTAAQSCAKEISTAEEVVMVDTRAYGPVTTTDIGACNGVTVTGMPTVGATTYAITTKHPNGSTASFIVKPGTGVQRVP